MLCCGLILDNTRFHSIPGGNPGLISALQSLRSSIARFSPYSATISSHMGEFLISLIKLWINFSEKASSRLFFSYLKRFNLLAFTMIHLPYGLPSFVQHSTSAACPSACCCWGYMLCLCNRNFLSSV